MLISVSELIDRSIALYKQHWREFMLYAAIVIAPVTILSFVGELFAPAGSSAPEFGGPYAFIFVPLMIVFGFASVWFSLAFIRVIAARYTGGVVQPMKEEFLSARNKFGTAILASLLTGLIVFGGFLLFIIPGIIFAIWFAFSIYAIAIDNAKAVDSLKQSKALVKGRWFAIFWRGLAVGMVFGLMAFIPQALVGFIAEMVSKLASSTPVTIIMNILAIALSTAIALFIAPLGTSANTILYLEAKKTPVTPPQFPPAQS